MKRTLNTPEEILSYGMDVIQKHHRQLFNLNYGTASEIIDESNNEEFNLGKYGEWKHKVKDYIKKHEPDKFDEINRLFYSFDILYSPNYLSEILGILSVSVGNLKSEEKGGNPDNSRTSQTANGAEVQNQFEPEPEPIEANPPEEKKKENIWKIIGKIAAIATIISAIFAGLSYFFK